MNTDIIRGLVIQLKGHAQRTLGNLIECDRDIMLGNRMIFDGKIHERLGWAKMKARREFKAAH